MVPRRKTRKPSVDLAPEVLSAVDGLERALRVSQLRAGKTQKKALGRHVHGRAPYAYSSDRGLLRPVEGLAPIVVRIFSGHAWLLTGAGRARSERGGDLGAAR